MNQIITGRWAWVTAVVFAYVILAIFVITAGVPATKEVIDLARVVTFAIIAGTFAPVGIYIMFNGLTAPKYHWLLGTFAMGTAVLIQGGVIFARRMFLREELLLFRPDWLTSPLLDLFVAFNVVLAGFLFLSGPHLADPDIPKKTFRWVIISVGAFCAIAGVLVGRYLTPG